MYWFSELCEVYFKYTLRIFDFLQTIFNPFSNVGHEIWKKVYKWNKWDISGPETSSSNAKLDMTTFFIGEVNYSVSISDLKGFTYEIGSPCVKPVNLVKNCVNNSKVSAADVHQSLKISEPGFKKWFCVIEDSKEKEGIT